MRAAAFGAGGGRLHYRIGHQQHLPQVEPIEPGKVVRRAGPARWRLAERRPQRIQRHRRVRQPRHGAARVVQSGLQHVVVLCFQSRDTPPGRPPVRGILLRALPYHGGLALESLLVASALGAGCLLAGLGGLALRPRLSEHHLDDESRGGVSNITGLIAAMAALLLGLLVASAQSSYNTVNDEVDQLAANLVEFDRTLDALGPATADVRALLRQMATTETDRIWPLGSGSSNPDALDAWRM